MICLACSITWRKNIAWIFVCLYCCSLPFMYFPVVIQFAMIESWNYCSNWCFSGWRVFRSLIPAEVGRILIESKGRVSFFTFNSCSFWRRLRVVEMFLLASCHVFFVEVMHIFVFFLIFVLRSIYGVTRIMSLTVFVRHVQFLPLFSSKKLQESCQGSTKRNITTIEVTLIGRIWKKFSFLDAQSVKLAFPETYRNYSPNFVRENQSWVGYRWITQSSKVAVRARKMKKILMS